jgi:hypothetical protein
MGVTSTRLIIERLLGLRFLRTRNNLVQILFMHGDRVFVAVDVNRDDTVLANPRDLTADANLVAFLNLSNHPKYLALGGATAR